MTNKEAVETLKQMRAEIANDHKWLALDRAIDALEERPQYVIKVKTAVDAQKIADELNRQTALGVVLPEEFEIKHLDRPHGKWNEILEPFGWDDIKSAQCSACGESYPYPTDCGFDDIVEMFKYCPECGAKMEAGTRWKEEEEGGEP